MKRLTALFIIGLGLAVFCTAQAADTARYGIFRQEGIASWYGKEFAGRPTASGESFNPSQLTAAHPTLPFGTMLKITNQHNNKQVTVRVNDRGPFVSARIIDISEAAAEQLDMISTGTAPVSVESVGQIALPSAPGTNAARTAQGTALPSAQPLAKSAPGFDEELDGLSSARPVPVAAMPRPAPLSTVIPSVPPTPTQTYQPEPVPVQSYQAQQAPAPTYQGATIQPQYQPQVVPAPLNPPTSVRPIIPPIQPAPAPVQAYQNVPAQPQYQPQYQPTAAPAQTYQPVTAQPQYQPTAAPTQTYQPPTAPVTTLPPAEILPAMPPEGTGKVYRLQVGSYKVPRNAAEAFEKLKSAGLNPAYERNGEMYRIVLAGVRPEEMQSVAGRLGTAGFRQVLIREDAQ
ncbi:hypothetical protein FACS1894130_03510 [Spirochaetia bacterium]|nr:hypothetical protein FACS1894130_03510 [Spirochaetia bacterium]